MARKIINVKIKGDLSRTRKFFNIASDKKLYRDILTKYAVIGLEALKANTQIDTGNTINSWSYNLILEKNILGIEWTNSNLTSDGTPVVILLQYGHGTNNGGYVRGRDFINTALKPVFNQIADEAWAEVTKL